MRRALRLWLRHVGLLMLLSAGCGDGTVTPEDGGQVGQDATVPPQDTGPEPDRIAPEVTSTRPRNGEDLVARTADLEIRFSERMAPSSGTITAISDGVVLTLGTREWLPEGDVLRVGAEGGWPGGARIDVRIEGFTDLAGNTQEGAYEFVFHTSDDGAPTIVGSDPTEGATEVPVDLSMIVVRFSEPMNPVLGTVVLEGGPGEVGGTTWATATELHATVDGLEAGTSYRLVLEGFEDRSGNALDGVPFAGDGAIDFTTAPDTTPPTVVDSNPTNAQIELDVHNFETVTLVFSEPMDTSVRTATLTAGSSTTTLTGNWSLDATVLTFNVVGRLTVDAEHRLDLSAMRDRAGNALDGTVALDQGALVFTTAATDEALPFVVFTTPTEGATDVSTRTTELVVQFSEAMDVSSTTLELVSATDTRMLTGTWNAAGTRITASLGDGLAALTDYRVDLTAFTDLSGNTVDMEHPYLLDGVLNFRTTRPTGENCADPLTIAEAVFDGSGYTWDLPGGAFRTADGAFSCNTANTNSGVIVYEKTSADLANGGRALHITTTRVDHLNGISFEIFRDVCDRRAPGGGLDARVLCVWKRPYWSQYVDLPAGTYYIWVSTPGSTADFDGGSLRIEEVSAIPRGESCDTAYDTSAPNYTSPAADAHEWLIEHGAFQSVDYGDGTSGNDTFPCATRQGPDGVVRIPKARDGSILDIQIDPFPAESISGTDIFDRAGVIAEVLSACEPRAAETTSLACPGRINNPENFQVVGSAGDYWLWLASNNTQVDNVRTTVRVREVDPGPGETCQTAIEITPGASIPVTPSATTRFFAPSCIDEGNVTWYRYRTTREVNLVSVVGTGPIALVDPTNGREIKCMDNGSQIGIPRRAPIGTEVCIAVPSGSGVTGLSIRESDWRGVEGVATNLMIARPVTETGTEVSITSEAWLAVTPTQIYMGINPNTASTAALVAAPRTGNATADRLLLDRFTFGNAAVAFGEALFSVEETNRPERLHRLIDSTGSLSPTVWDTGSTYDPQDIDTLAQIGTSTELAMVSDIPNSSSATPITVFYRADSTTPGAVTRVGETQAIRNVVAIAATAEWIFLMGSAYDGDTHLGAAIYRLPWSDVTAAPEMLVPPELVSIGTTNGSMAYDGTRDILYFRQGRSPAGVHAVFDAASTTPYYAGEVIAIGSSADYGLAIDTSVPELFLFETSTVSTGAFARIR